MKRPVPEGPPMPDGLLLIDKPAGPTSHDVVDLIRRRFRIPKVGHGGSLDPQATGLMIILIGKGTKISDRFLGSDKEYEGAIRLGLTTNSYDLDGEVTSTAPFEGIARERLLEAMGAFQGDLMQTPPMVSAIKKNGVPLYKLARQGETVERAARLIHLYEFSLLSFAPPDLEFRIRCTKGTYIRSIAHDLGQALGCGAALARLHRTASGAFRVARAMPLDTALSLSPAGLAERIVPLAEALPNA
jgi:tRNA pseudouridine55 synthase